LTDEIATLIAGSMDEYREPIKAKTAWAVIANRHSLTGKTSYESFKRFVRGQDLCPNRAAPIVRLETKPGKEVQIDYGRVGIRLVMGRP